MKMFQILRMLILAGLFSIGMAGLSACEQEGPYEETGEAIDEGIDDAGDAVDDAADELEDAAEDLDREP